MKTICILGSTGSIGVNTLDIVRQHPDLFQAGILVANKNIERLFEQVTEFKP
ncbi:MAG: 1-deoxy-D-xylulose-5-phosphate reductoisomerase, partial [Calditrichales bacterium]